LTRRVVSARARNRTENLGIKSPLLCQLSYAGAEATPPRPPEVDSTALTGTVHKASGQAYARRMRARMPQDVDLEDKLIYGLTPVRFGYLVIAALTAVLLWNLAGLPAYLRLPGCLALCAAGALLGWGRFAGRPADRFLADALLFFGRTYRIRRRHRRWSEIVPVSLRAINDAWPSGPREPRG
jgi:PrgI family protein